MTTDPFVQILMIIVPALIVFLTSFYLVKNFLDNEGRKRAMEVKTASRELVTPLRLQAYERIVMFLERISPNSMIPRINRSTFNARQLHTELLAAIRTEFEHNLSQQIYISNGAWEMVKNAKEEISKLVNMASVKVADNAPGSELAQMIIDVSSAVGKLPTHHAIDYIKKEIAQNF